MSELRLGNHRHPVDACPNCEGPKLKRAKYCKACSPKMRSGEWRAKNPSRSAGHYRARVLRPLGPCEFPDCSEPGRDRHHIDGDPLNNTIENIAVYCRRHHMEVDGRLAKLPAWAQLGGDARRKAA